jgi:uncharacterized FAD-dependent dehydrogenase
LDYDVIIIGAGPAGMFGGYELVEKTDFKVLIVDMGLDAKKRKCPIEKWKQCAKCDPCHIMSGVGGAGTLSSGLLNLRPDIGGNINSLVGNNSEVANNLIQYVDDIFQKFGAPKELYKPTQKESEELSRKAAAAGIEFVPIPQRHIGTDMSPVVIQNMKDYLVEKGIKFMLKTRITKIEPHKVILNNGNELKAKYILAAPGRVGAEWMKKQGDHLGIKTKHTPIDVGLRVEIPSVILAPIYNIARDPKFHIYTDKYDDFVRTFCVNHKGFVVEEVYDGFIGVNGHALVGKRSENSNFAFLVRVALTEPLEDTTAYALSIANQTSILGGRKPILQRLGDLKHGNRSTWERINRSSVRPTLKSVTPGDIAMALPHRILTDIIEGLDKLDSVIPGVASPTTLLYAPEIKFSANRFPVDKNLETTIEDLFVAGDGVGLSRGLVQAAVTGIIAAKGIINKNSN